MVSNTEAVCYSAKFSLWIKIWMSHFDYDGTKASIDCSLQLLGTDYIDMMLLHQPLGTA